MHSTQQSDCCTARAERQPHMGRDTSRVELSRRRSSAFVKGDDPEENHEGYERKGDGKRKYMHLILENRNVGL